MNIKYLLFLLTVVASVVSAKRSYEGYKVFKVIPKTQDAVDLIINLQKSGFGEIWENYVIVGLEIKFMVTPTKLNKFLETIGTKDIEFVLVIEDVQRLINSQLNPANNTNRRLSSFLTLDWESYHTLDEIYGWLDELELNYPGIVTTVVMGKSVEDRKIKGIKINYKNNPNRNGTSIGMLEGCLHAREWISPAVVTWIIKEFLTSTDPEVRFLAENIEWHIFPVVNPDGYVYTFTDDRMWRKNRNTTHFTSCAESELHDDRSNGIDLNRNFDFFWNTAGTSDDPCSNLFPGGSANSEAETRAITDYVLQLKDQGEIIYYLAFHSYTQLIIVPYSHLASVTDEGMASNYNDMYEIAIRGASKMEERFGTHYRVGLSADVLYPMSGTSFDWVKYRVGVPVSYLIELRDLGRYGFLLPPEEIIPNSLEIMDAVLEMDKTTRGLGYYTGAATVVSSTIILIVNVILMTLFN